MVKSKKIKYINHLKEWLKHDGYSPDYDLLPVIPLKELYRVHITWLLKGLTYPENDNELPYYWDNEKLDWVLTP